MADTVEEPRSNGRATPEASDNVVEQRRGERRRYPRSESFYPVRIHVQRLGAAAVLTNGILLNVSRGGALLSVDGYLPRDQPCEVEIYGAAGRVIPHRVFSRVVETRVGPGDDFRIRVEFSKPLESITRPDEI
jgi:hypothetical protein